MYTNERRGGDYGEAQSMGVTEEYISKAEKEQLADYRGKFLTELDVTYRN